MLIGHNQLIDDFKKLTQNNKLSHAYLFFGEPQVGKFFFAKCLVNFLENKTFAPPAAFLSETLFVLPDEGGSIGIGAARSLRHFLYQKPTFSRWRTVIIRDAENLTSEARSAILKILEEPPIQSLIIFIANDYEALLPPVLSRLQKIYFPPVASAQIEDFLIKKRGLSKKDARRTAVESFGRPGRAMDLLSNDAKLKLAGKAAKEFLRTGNLRARRAFIKKYFFDKQGKFDDELMDKFFEFLIIELRRNPVRNVDDLREVFRRLTLIKQFNVNKKLQIQCL